MRVNGLNRMVVAAGICAVAMFGLGAPASARPQQGQEGKRESKPQAKAKTQAPQGKAQQQPAQKKEAKAQAKQQRQLQRLAAKDQQERIRLQRQRLAQYRAHLDQQQRLAPPRSAQLKQQNRAAQYGFQQQYLARLREQLLRIQSQDRYDYGRDPYFYTPASYRYSRGGRYYETNQYGVDLLRQAVNYGYEEGRLAGMADRQDRWESGYEDSYAYQDANYGYGGFYVDRDDYNAYFREGFRRGYEDGYDGGSRYGRYADGRSTILAEVLAAILNFEAIR